MSRYRAHRLPASPVDGWCGAAVGASAALAAVAVTAALHHAGALDGLALCGLVLLYALPGALAALERRLSLRGIELGANLAVALWLGLAGGLAVVASASALAAAVAWLHGLAAARARRDRNAAAALGIGAATGLVVAAVQPGPVTAALSALLWIAAGVGGSWVHARASRRQFLRGGEPALGPPVERRGMLARSVAVGSLLAVVLLVMSLLEVGVAAQRRYAARPRPEREASLTDAQARATAEAQAAADLEQAARAERLRSVWPSGVDWRSELQPGQERLMAEVACSLDVDGPWFDAARPLHLRAFALDTIDGDGLSLSEHAAPLILTDAGSGVEDGWIEILPRAPGRPGVEFALRQRDHRLADGNDARHPVLMLHTERLMAVEAASVRYASGTSLQGLAAADGLLRARWVAQPWIETRAIATTDAVHPRYLQWPTDDPRFDAWRAEGEALAAGASDAEEILARVQAHFADGWAYDLQPGGLDGIAALESFFTRRRGYCSLFATGALLYLRAAGIPCRLVTGYRVTRYRVDREDGRGVYQAFNSDAHAWLEVALEGGHWRIFEPTPRRAYQAALAAADRAQGSAEGLDAAAPSMARSGSSESLSAETADHVPDGAGFHIPWWLPSGRSGYGYAVGLLIALLGHYATRTWLERLERRRLAEAYPEAGQRSDEWLQLVRLLRGYGFHPRRGDTPLEFARAVRRAGGPLFAGIEPVVRVLYRQRFGQLELDGNDRMLARRYAETLGSESFRARWEEQTGGER